MRTLFGEDDILSTRLKNDEKEPVLLVGVWTSTGQEYESEDAFTHSMDELAELAKACSMDPVMTVTQKLPKADQALYVREGKAEEILYIVKDQSISRVLFNDTLSPSQLRNLQKLLGVPVTDRTRLILEIFERRARTREAKLQVALAKLQYLRPRLIGLWETQNRQGGASGSLSSKGEGEKQLELDRRTIGRRIAELRRELALVSRERETQRKKRNRSQLPSVALVGYTNAGKSTILNAMIEHWGDLSSAENKKVLEEDMLFATLDTSIRQIRVENGRAFLLSDTVGFIQDLPASLVEAFHSTLEEAAQADLIVQVVDGSDPHCDSHIRTTQETLVSLGAAHIPHITVYNKSDLRDPQIEYPRRGMRESDISGETNENLYISAKEPDSIELLTRVILEKLERANLYREFLIPYAKGNVQAFLSQNAHVETCEYREDGIFMQVSCSPAAAGKAEQMLAADSQ